MATVTYPLGLLVDDAGLILSAPVVTIASVVDKSGSAIASHGATVNGSASATPISVDYDAETKGEAWITLSVSQSGKTITGTNATLALYAAKDSGRIDAAISSRSTYTGGAVASVTASVAVGSIATDAISAAAVSAAAVTKIASGVASPSVPSVSDIRIEMDANSTKLAKLDANISTRLPATSTPTSGTIVVGSTGSIVIVSGLPSGKDYATDKQHLYYGGANGGGETRQIASHTYSGGNYTFTMSNPFTSVTTGDTVVITPGRTV